MRSCDVMRSCERICHVIMSCERSCDVMRSCERICHVIIVMSCERICRDHCDVM